jgi:hypothetical protein
LNGFFEACLDVMFVRMIDVLKGEGACPPDKSGGYRMIDVPNKKLLPNAEGAMYLFEN